jgi:hypothetical protein
VPANKRQEVKLWCLVFKYSVCKWHCVVLVHSTYLLFPTDLRLPRSSSTILYLLTSVVFYLCIFDFSKLHM